LYLILAALLTGCLQAPVSGPVVAGFAPQGLYGGHWGIDFAVPVGTPVGASTSGRVSFAGEVAGMKTVTVDHGGGLRSSVSYLSTIAVAVGTSVSAGQLLGTSGWAHGYQRLHFSVRVGDTYVDPMTLLACAGSAPGSGLRLLPPP
jgi:murein DD-endopeptidase MepM/ murein hydrolase activator NlpD